VLETLLSIVRLGGGVAMVYLLLSLAILLWLLYVSVNEVIDTETVVLTLEAVFGLLETLVLVPYQIWLLWMTCRILLSIK
jgi:hypothetical protein